jgi:biopolymer transport protein ExbD
MKNKDNSLSSKLGKSEISAGAMADIAFLLLVFFFVCATITEDKGILVKLPPYDIAPPPPVAKRNVFNILVNAQNQTMVEGQIVPVASIADQMKEFILNPGRKKNLPAKPNAAIISLHCDRSTSYEKYIEVYDALKSTYHELWDRQSLESYGKLYDQLEKIDQKSIRSVIPLLISEAESTDLALK